MVPSTQIDAPSPINSDSRRHLPPPLLIINVVITAHR